jgi:hypothetical protein
MTQPQKFFILIGAPKSGTTTLSKWLGRHPNVQLHPTKEPRFFTRFSDIEWSGPGAQAFSDSLVSNENSYLEEFKGISAGTWAMDASTDYLWCEDSPELIKK